MTPSDTKLQAISIRKRRRTSDADSFPVATATTSRRSPAKRQYLGPCHLLNLPHELILRIFQFLSPPTLLKLSLTNHKIHALASDSQVWKGLFYRRFVGPRSRQQSSAGGTGERQLWRDDYILLQKERENVLRDVVPGGDGAVRQEKVEEGRVDVSMRRVGLDWKAKYRLRHNWFMGASQTSRIAISKQEMPLIVKYHKGYIFNLHNEKGFVIYSTSKDSGRGPKILLQVPVDVSYGRCLELAFDECPKSKDDIDIALSFQHAIVIYNYNYTTNRLIQIHHQKVVGTCTNLAWSAPYLACIFNQVLNMYTLHPPSPTTMTSTTPPKPGYAKPELLFSQLNNTTFNFHLSIRQDDSDNHTIVSIVFIKPAITGNTATVQEYHFHPHTHEFTTSRFAIQETLETLFHRMPFIDPSSITYAHPYILTSHPDNTLTLYTVSSTPESLTISKPHTLWGHCSAVLSVTAEKSRAVSIDISGEIRIWTLPSTPPPVFSDRDSSTTTSTTTASNEDSIVAVNQRIRLRALESQRLNNIRSVKVKGTGSWEDEVLNNRHARGDDARIVDDEESERMESARRLFDVCGFGEDGLVVCAWRRIRMMGCGTSVEDRRKFVEGMLWVHDFT